MDSTRCLLAILSALCTGGAFKSAVDTLARIVDLAGLEPLFRLARLTEDEVVVSVMDTFDLGELPSVMVPGVRVTPFRVMTTFLFLAICSDD